MIFAVKFVCLFGALIVAAHAGIAVYVYRDRLALALGILRGHIVYDEKKENGKFGCGREHVEGDAVVVKKKEYEDLKNAAAQLVFAQGYIADVEAIRGKTTYAQRYEDIGGR